MASFKPNTFNPIYPESNDKKGEIQLIQIAEASPVDDSFTEVMRLDMLPIIKRTSLNYAGIGRQKMYRTVRSATWDLPWVAASLSTESFLSTIAEQTEPWTSSIRTNAIAYVDLLNLTLADEGFAESIQLTHVHVIDSSIQFGEKGTDHIFFQTFDVVFYGQQSPNPFIAPAPPAPICEKLPNYEWQAGFPISPSTKGINYVDPSDNTIAYVELYSKGGGTGVNFSTACTFNFADEPDLVVGQFYAIKVSYTALPTGVTLPVTFKPNYVLAGTAVLNDSGDPIYVLAQKTTTGPINFRIETGPQSPTNVETEPIFTVELFTPECIS